MIKLALNDTAIILFLLLKTLDKYEYLSEFYYQLFQIFKEHINQLNPKDKTN